MSKTENKTETQDPLITQLLALLRGGQAHADFESAIKDFPAEHCGTVVSPLPYSAWQLLEHIRFTQRDILDFSAPPTGGYHGHKWPDAYWPKSPVPPSASSWQHTIDEIRSDQKKFESLLLKPNVDLYKPFLWGDGQNLLREALLIADHNAYHLGEFILLRRLLGIWHS